MAIRLFFLLFVLSIIHKCTFCSWHLFDSLNFHHFLRVLKLYLLREEVVFTFVNLYLTLIVTLRLRILSQIVRFILLFIGSFPSLKRGVPGFSKDLDSFLRVSLLLSFLFLLQLVSSGFVEIGDRLAQFGNALDTLLLLVLFRILMKIYDRVFDI